jgi:sulfur carrier protein
MGERWPAAGIKPARTDGGRVPLGESDPGPLAERVVPARESKTPFDADPLRDGMELTVEVAGEDTEVVELDDGATYAEVVEAVGLHPQEASVLVDGRPVPGDQAVDTDSVTVLRLIKGG